MNHHWQSTIFAVAALLAGPAAMWTQAPTSTSMKFEVASIKPADPNSRGPRGFGRTPGGGLKATSVSLKWLIAFAYDVPEFRISGWPRWVESERFDILAKPERLEADVESVHTTKSQMDQVRERTRSLLTERFQLSIHKESKELSYFALVTGKTGPKLGEPKEGGVQGIRQVGRGELFSDSAPLDLLAGALTQNLGRVVHDETGLSGRFAFKLNWTPDGNEVGGQKPGLPPQESNPGDSGPSIFSALQEQLGLKLESRKGKLEVIVIDRVEKPTEN